MLENERATLFGVAGVADHILGGRCSHLLRCNRSVWIVAITALDEPLIYAMMKRHIELGFLSSVAGIAELGLFFYQQQLGINRVMRRMTRDAADIVFRVDGI